MNTKSVKLIIAAPETDSNLYYACRFLAPDQLIYLEIGGEKLLVCSSLEIDRARKEAKVDRVLPLSAYTKGFKYGKKGQALVHTFVADKILKQKKTKSITVPSNFPASHYKFLRDLHYNITIKPDPFFERRLVKTESEKKHIRQSLEEVEKVLMEVILILQRSKIRGKRIYHGKTLITSEMLKSIINMRLMENGCAAHHTIVSSGLYGSFPHHEGRGPIIPHTPIIFDIFPRHIQSRYWGDMTRTVVKGKPSSMARKMFEAVLEAGRKARKIVAPGVSAKDIHNVTAACLKKNGFKTGKIKGSMQGFIHSTGHGVGLDIHELPSISPWGGTIKKGNVFTIEPGLYYKKHGGVRIEDVIYVTNNGHEMLSTFPVFLEIDKI